MIIKFEATKFSFLMYWRIILIIILIIKTNRKHNIRNLSHHTKIKLSKLWKEFCKENFNIKLVFNSFKLKNYFAYKDPVPNGLKSFLVYEFTCASLSSSYIGETCRHFKTRWRSMSNRITSLIFLKICTLPKHALSHIILFVLNNW